MIRVAGSMELSNHFCDSPFLCLPLEIGDSGWEALFESQMRGFPFFLVSRIRGQSKPTALTPADVPFVPVPPIRPLRAASRLRGFRAGGGAGLRTRAQRGALGRRRPLRRRPRQRKSPGNPEVWVKTKPPAKSKGPQAGVMSIYQGAVLGLPYFGPTARWLWLQKHVY